MSIHKEGLHLQNIHTKTAPKDGFNVLNMLRTKVNKVLAGPLLATTLTLSPQYVVAADPKPTSKEAQLEQQIDTLQKQIQSKETIVGFKDDTIESKDKQLEGLQKRLEQAKKELEECKPHHPVKKTVAKGRPVVKKTVEKKPVFVPKPVEPIKPTEVNIFSNNAVKTVVNFQLIQNIIETPTPQPTSIIEEKPECAIELFDAQSTGKEETHRYDIGVNEGQVGIVFGNAIQWGENYVGGEQRGLVVLKGGKGGSWYYNVIVGDGRYEIYNICDESEIKKLAVERAKEQNIHYGAADKIYNQIPTWQSVNPSPPVKK